MNKVFIQLLKARGLSPSFLHPQYQDLCDPFVLRDMQKAISRLEVAIKNHEKILIYGDYDVDGVTASTVMEQALLLAGVRPTDITIMLPDRFADGYGMSPKLIECAKKTGATLVVTVDCGSLNHAIIDELNFLKIDSIVTDHHETTDQMPAAIAVINPHRKDAPTPALQHLAGVGVAFKAVQALVQAGLVPSGQEKWLLDLVLIGTICDNMPLTGENRILGFYGLKVLAKTRRPGLKELMARAGVKKLHAEAIGFQIGPRLNAAGRLDTAELSLNLLRTSSAADAAALANQLEELNKKRKTEQISAIREIEKRGVGQDPVIIETGNWHEGVLGIVAGRLVETYHKPAFVLTHTKEGILKGSGRSFGDFNLAEALSHVKTSLLSGGGHAAAAGVKLDQAKLYQFREQINAYYDSLGLKNQERFLTPQPDLATESLADFDLDFLKDLELLEPFGAGNAEPLFCLKNVEILESRKMGSDSQHLRLDIKDQGGKTMKLVAFFAPDDWLKLEPGEILDIVVRITDNEWNGHRSVEGRIVDVLH
ncbi:single-stranded-DNA-specific exonuclease RecJ [Candidatus Saccharibacteria bacterium]|nr:single-stranded-DNA-specific exonuclease RecJ [Candidatus Saccharibacteria bacterium]